ncbi:MAG: radical SAM protein [Armatimonadetes bacterium]|nr:radical SAM protein [Armatimonadota bacterium]
MKMLWAAPDGAILEDSRRAALGRSGNEVREPRPEELSPLPAGAVLQYLPARTARGLGRRGSVESGKGYAVAAMLPNGWARTLLPAYEAPPGVAPLPFFGYTAVALRGDEMLVAAIQTEENYRWSPFQYGTPDLPDLVARRLAEQPDNRLLTHHAHCALDYGCYNAQNVFYRRWEGAVAVSAACNAKCRGCISLQPEDMPPSPQDRLDFVPTVGEIVEIGVPHLESADAILSFGQGCEGEPLLKADLIAASIREIRKATSRGTIHLNTNASAPKAVARLIDAGLQSIRVSLNTVTSERYAAYYVPQKYAFADVEETVRICRAAGLQIALNLLFFPGLNDLEDELDALEQFIARHRVDQVQMRNLNIDPDLYLASQPPLVGRAVGIPEMVRRLRKVCAVGNATPGIARAIQE